MLPGLSPKPCSHGPEAFARVLCRTTNHLLTIAHHTDMVPNGVARAPYLELEPPRFRSFTITAISSRSAGHLEPTPLGNFDISKSFCNFGYKKNAPLTSACTPPGINSFKTFMAYKGVFMVRDDEVRQTLFRCPMCVYIYIYK